MRFTQEQDELLSYLYISQSIFNWNIISKEFSERTQTIVAPEICRNRYIHVYGPVIKDEWTLNEEKELYRLHNEYGNRWAVISQNLLGRYILVEQRSDNCVKNHFYSKLRKSLRTVNRLAKQHLKKQVKEISDVVIYKLTEATDEALKEKREISEEIVVMTYGMSNHNLDLKNRLLEYEVDERESKQITNFDLEKDLLLGLGHFNKAYKKKSKKEKISLLGAENLKKRRAYQNKREEEDELDSNYLCQSQSEIDDENEIIEVLNKMRTELPKIMNPIESELNKEIEFPKITNDQEQFKSSFQKKTKNFFIKPPAFELKRQMPEEQFLKDNQSGIEIKNEVLVPFNLGSPKPQPKIRKVEDILKAEGILENSIGECVNENYFRRDNSHRSSSNYSESENPDMFAEDLNFVGNLQNLNEMPNDRIFRTEERLFRTEERIFKTQQND